VAFTRPGLGRVGLCNPRLKPWASDEIQILSYSNSHSLESEAGPIPSDPTFRKSRGYIFVPCSKNRIFDCIAVLLEDGSPFQAVKTDAQNPNVFFQIAEI
jgi:hypothetical protein